MLEISQGVAYITLARPERANALSAELVRELHSLTREATHDGGVHTIAFKGEGKHFCSGFDLSDVEQSDDANLLSRFVEVEMFLDEVWRAPVRTAVIAQGRTWGAGADLFAACDVRLAARDADFRFPGAGFGLVLGTRRLGVRVGRDHVRRFTSEGASADAERALACGLVTGLAPDSDPVHLIERCRASSIDRATIQALRAVTSAQDSDADLAALVRSAARPGLRQRILDYRARLARPAKPREPS
jgi:enoyl-CoA hydratase